MYVCIPPPPHHKLKPNPQSDGVWRWSLWDVIKWMRFLLVCSVLFDSCDPRTAALQASLSMGFPGQKYWSKLPFPFPRYLSDPGIKTTTPEAPALAGEFFTTEPPVNGISAPLKEVHKSPCHLSYVKCQREDGNLWTRRQALTRHGIWTPLDHRVPSLQNREK